MRLRRITVGLVLTGLMIISLCGCHFHVTAHAAGGALARAAVPAAQAAEQNSRVGPRLAASALAGRGSLRFFARHLR